MRRARSRAVPALVASTLATLALGTALPVPAAGAQGLEDDGGASWRLEQPPPPSPPPGVSGSSTPIPLGRPGDVQFYAPNRGLLITAGNGSTIPAGLWAYNGQRWHELSTVCGATDGRIAWAGPDEFWTVSDGRPGQASVNGKVPPTEDDSLCHFANGEVVGSYASPAFQASSYQPMHAAGCFLPAPSNVQSDCWFGGDPLPAPGVGAFHLFWNGQSLTAAPNPQGHAVQDMRLFEGRLFESVRVRPDQQPPDPSEEDRLSEPEPPGEPSLLHEIEPAGVEPPFISLHPGVPLYAPGEFPTALGFLHLSADENSLWGAAGGVLEPPSGSARAKLTVVRYTEGSWSQPIGALGSEPPGGDPLAEDVVNSIAAEPGTDSAWLAVDTQADAQTPSPTAPATVVRVSADGTLSDEQTFPAKGAAKQISCPAPHDCWMATTQGWLFHLAPEGEEQLPVDSDPAFSESKLITVRPADQGLPQVAPDAPPIDDSGLLGEPPSGALAFPQVSTEQAESKVTEPLLSNLHSRLVHKTTLELRFHLAVRATVRLIAKRKKRVVASTPTRTFASGSRSLLLKLNRKRWPTKLDLQSHALAPLPQVSTRGDSAATDSVSTSVGFLTDLGLPAPLLALSSAGPLL